MICNMLLREWSLLGCNWSVQLTFISGKKLKRKNNCSSFNLVRITQKRPESRNQSKTWNQVKNELQSNDSIESVLKNELQWLT